MAVVRVSDQDLTLRDDREIAEYLKTCNIDYERWQAGFPVAADATAEEILSAYADDIEKLKARGGYVTADVIDVSPDTAGLEGMLAKFNREHWHDEDEVRFTIAGHGLFHIRPQTGPVVAITVEPGDLIRIPRGTWHWFNLCDDRRIRAIRLFQEMAGWSPHYTGSDVDKDFLPVCFGLSHLPQKVHNKL